MWIFQNLILIRSEQNVPSYNIHQKISFLIHIVSNLDSRLVSSWMEIILILINCRCVGSQRNLICIVKKCVVLKKVWICDANDDNM
jgi:hypothetical protein